MEEAPVVDCPPTPEILPLSSTPPPRPDVVYSSSSEEGDEPTDGRRSPPPKCAICLGKCRQRAYTNSCKHQFCFRCLLEWSKVKPECPLCKQRFLSIVYYKSIDCYEQHTVAVPSANVSRVSTRNMYHELNLFLTNSQRFTAYAIPNMTLRLQSNNERLQDLLLHQSSEVDRFIREYGNQPIPTRQDELRWRQFIYANRLYACPLPDLNGRFRETSAAFYRENPAQVHRVLSWMHRDLLVLSTNIALQSPDITMLEELLQTHDIDSREFLLRLLRNMPLEVGEHFQHECTNFARSPYDMIGYDRCVQYNPRFVQRRVRSQVIISSSEEDNDDIVYLPEPAAGTSSNNEPVVVDGSAGGEGVSNGNGGASGGVTGSNSTATSGTTNARTGRGEVHIEFRSLTDGVGNEEVRPVATSGTLPRIPLSSTVSSSVVASENILLSSSDSDDCQFVMAQKPPHLRTPDHVVDLESASDSDVVFVAEEPLESRATLRTTRQQQQGNSLKKETAGMQEYNNGASTSSGYCGGGNGGGGSSGSVASGSALRSKYYVRPRSNRYTGGMGVKSIYEASDTDDSDSDTLFNFPQGRRTLSNTANDSCSHDEVEFTTGQRNRRKPNKKTTSAAPKGGSKRASRKRRNSSISSSSSDGDSSSDSSSSSSDGESNISSSNSTCSSSNSNSSGNSSSRSSGASSSYNAYAGSGSTTYHKNFTAEIECGRQLRRNTAHQSRATHTIRSKPDQTDSKGRTKKKRSRRTIEKEAKHGKERSAKSRHPSKSKKKSQSASRSARDVAKGSRTKSKSGARGVTGRSSKGNKKRSKPSTAQDDEPSRSTPTLDEDMLGEENASAHYVIASRPSVSPTVDVTSVDGTECRERKLKSVIIKRCHYNKSSTNRTNAAMEGVEGAQPGSVASTAIVPEDCVVPSTSTLLPGAATVPEGESFAKMEPVDIMDALKHEQPAVSEMQHLFSSSSSSDSEPEATSAADFTDSGMYSAVASLVQMHRNALLHPTTVNQQPEQQHQQQQEMPHNPNQQHAQPNWPQLGEYIQEQLQLPISDNDQQPQALGYIEPMLDADESNTVASESIFEPTLSWAETDRPLIPEDRGLSSAAASPFSSISFPPSTTSVSPSPSISSQSLVLAAATSPLQLIESLGTMDGDSPLPSSVLSLNAIDGAMDEIMATEVVSATATIAEPSIGSDGADNDHGSAAPCELEPTTSEGAVPAVQLQL